MLTRMLVPAPYQVPAKEDKEESRKAKGGLHSEGTLDTVSGEIRAPSSEDKKKEKLTFFLPMVRKGPPPKVGRKRLLSEARCPYWVAQAWRTTSSRSTTARTSLRTNRK